MDKYAKANLEKRINKVMQNLERNNMQAFYAEDKEEALRKVSELINEGDTVGLGGSVTLDECGVLELLRNGKYNFLDRYEKGLSRDEIEQIFIDSFSADAYISSTNAITENGELYNVDGNSNRVAAICYGPKSVIIVAGYNKIVRDMDAAIKRVRTVAAPANCMRLSMESYCSKTGECMAFKTGSMDMGSGCIGDGRICCNYVVSSYQRKKDRIKVIIVGEELGY